MEEARDVLVALLTSEVHEVFVLEAGRSPERYGRWLPAALTAALLP